EQLAAGPWGRAWPAAACIAIALNIFYFHTGTSPRDFPLAAAFSQERRAALLAERQPQRAIIPALNEMNTGASPVAWLAEPLAAGVSSDLLYPNWYNMRFLEEVNAAQSADAVLALMRRRGIEFVVADVQRPLTAALTDTTDEVTRRGTV